MDELTLLRRLGSDTPADDDAVARVRAQLTDRLAPTISDERHTKSGTVTVIRPRRHRTLRFAVAAGVTALLAVGGVTAATWSPDHTPPPAAANAATLLNQAATASLATSDPTLGAQQYRKITTVALWSTETVSHDGKGPAAWLDKETITTWVPADPSKQWVMQRSGRAPDRALNAAGAVMMKDMEPPQGETVRGKDGHFYPNEDAPSPGSEQASWGSPTPAWLSTLPRDATALDARLTTDAQSMGSSPDQEKFVLISDVLRTGMVPADLRASLYKVAAGIPGVELVDKSTNLEGRTGVAVGLDAGGYRQELIFDDTTGQVIGERDVLTAPHGDLPAGTTMSLTAVTTSVVDTAP